MKALIGDEPEQKTLEVDFEYVAPSEAYYHIVRQLLLQYLDGPQQEKLDISAMADHILERASIGSVIASSLGYEDPEKNPEYESLPDKEFDKIVLKANAKRDVYGFITILSLTKYKEKFEWMRSIYDYTLQKAEKYLSSRVKEFTHILHTLNIGLLVNERLVNMPADVVPDLHS